MAGIIKARGRRVHVYTGGVARTRRAEQCTGTLFGKQPIRSRASRHGRLLTS